ncbi:MAG: hypothetical protein CR997_05905 [Acidobacteria bacterium]|nr:MAG: hypothetical protein CR997_05905 [Acidobacteriota bacterium]
MKKRKILFLVLLCVLVVLLGTFYYLKQSVADFEGEITIDGLEHKVEIYTDAKGIPQIYAQTDSDLYFALGWVHASERLFQMELLRRVGTGRLAELFGKALLDYDKKNLQTAFRIIAEKSAPRLEPADRALTQAYINGINSWIKQANPLPPEFLILQIKPDEWCIEDVLTVAVYQSWFSHALMDRDHTNQWLIDQLGEEVLGLLMDYKDWSPPTVPPERELAHSALPDYAMASASNTWVLAPKKSTTNAAIHASDPHLSISQVPGLWLLAGLHSDEGTHFLGVTAPGLPFMAMGHNGQAAWSFTVGGIDIIDYLEFPRIGELEIQGPDGSIQLEKTEHSIQVRNEESVPYTTFFCHLGAVVEETPEKVRIMKWPGYDKGADEMLHAAYALRKTENFEAFRKTVTQFGALEVNWMYSDKNGNIGYQLGTPIPIREYANTVSVKDGLNPDMHWQGYLPLEETPYAFNPDCGWLASCNNQITETHLPGYYDPYRIIRISEALQAKDRLSPEESGALQYDTQSVVAKRWKDLCVEGLSLNGSQQLAQAVNEWDTTMSPDTKAGAFFQIWWREMTPALFQDDLADQWKKAASLKEVVLSENVEALIDRKDTPDSVENAAAISKLAVERALPLWKNRCWGEICTLTIEHPLSQVKILDKLLHLNRGPFPKHGAHSTLNSNFSSYSHENGTFQANNGPSMRYVLDWSDLDSFVINLPMGQSGNPFSPHYDDFLAYDTREVRWILPFSKEKVQEKAQHKMILMPLETQSH